METNDQNLNKKKNILIKRLIYFLVFVLLIAGGFVLYWLLIASHYQSTDDAYVNGYQNEVVAQINANVEEVLIDNSQKIQKGQLVISLDKTDYKIALSQAKADLEKAIRQYYSLKSNTAQTQENFDSKNTDYQKALLDFNRDKKSFAKGLMSKVDFENSQYHFQQTLIALNTAKEAFLNAKTQSLTEGVSEHPDVLKAIAQYKTAYINLKRTEIYSPIDGIVAKKNVNAGQRVAPNETLFSVVDISHEWVDANFKESQLKDLKIGQEVSLISDVNDITYSGYVGGIEAGSGSAFSLLPAQNATGNWIKIVQRVPVRVYFDQDSLKKNGELPLGTSIRVDVNLDHIRQKLPNAYNQQTNIFDIDETKLDQEIKNIIADNLPK